MISVADVIAARGISEVVHFTTNRGVLGMFARGAILSRRALPEEKYLEHVYTPNAEVRKDPVWTGHISLSISRVNKEFFGVSRCWHDDTETWWAIVSLDPAILCHDDVVFVTTNNIYPARKRGKGAAGLQALFADPVPGYYGHPTSRPADMPKSWTTDFQPRCCTRARSRPITCGASTCYRMTTATLSPLNTTSFGVVATQAMREPSSRSMSGLTSSAEDRRGRIRASALWAAYGDALGFISELTDRSGLRRRASVDRLTTTIPWSRRIGGQFGPTVKLPAGTISDDTQLRLATSRSLRPSGAFDVETFSEIELTSWPAYALGAGRGSLAAAANLRKRDTTWATNFFNAKNARYVNGGGNGAAMRVQPHVWATPADAPEYAWLADVIVNSVCTHGHERGFVGAAFHAGCVSFALRERRVPGPDDWLGILDGLRPLPAVIREDERLSEIWLGQWEKRAQRKLETAVEAVLGELADDMALVADAQPGQGRSAYLNAIEALKAYEAAQRGSGTKTSVLGALIAWVFAERPGEGLEVAANYFGTDTDSIATMSGAILGAAGVAVGDPPGEVQDAAYITREADRAWAAATGLRPPSFPYPDVLAWRPPRSGTDAVAADGDQLHLVGLGPGGTIGEPYVTAGKSPGVWQWMELWFGQSIIAKRRDRPPGLTRSHWVEPSSNYARSDLATAPGMTAGTSGARARNSPLPLIRRPPPDSEPRIEDRRGRQTDPPARAASDRRRERPLDEITDDVIKAGLTDDAIGAGIREVAGHERAIESGLGFAAVIVKAIAARQRQRPRDAPPS